MTYILFVRPHNTQKISSNIGGGGGIVAVAVAILYKVIRYVK